MTGISWHLSDQTQPRTFFRALFLKEKDEGIKEVTVWMCMIDKHSFFWLDSISIPFLENKRQSSGPTFGLNPKKVDDLPCSPFSGPRLILRGYGELPVILNLAFVQLSRPPYYGFTESIILALQFL